MGLFGSKKRIQELEAEVARCQAASHELSRRIQEINSQDAQLRGFLDHFGGPEAWQAKETSGNPGSEPWELCSRRREVRHGHWERTE